MVPLFVPSPPLLSALQRRRAEPTFPFHPHHYHLHHTPIMMSSNNASSGTTTTSRWCPTPEQLMILEELYRSGVRTPNASQIQRITAHLALYGKIEGKNVFYWFQNHKARDRQKLRRKLLKQLQLQQHHNQLCHHHYQQPQQQLILPVQLPENHHHEAFDNNARRHLLLNYFEYPNNSTSSTTATHPRFHEVLPNPPLPPPHHYPQVGRPGEVVEGGASSRAMTLTMMKKNVQTWDYDDDHRERHDYMDHMMIPAEVGFGGCQTAAAEDMNSAVMARMYGTDGRRWITPEVDEGHDDLDRSSNHIDNTIKTLPLFPVTSPNLIEDRGRN